jgi:hypothetical protein
MDHLKRLFVVGVLAVLGNVVAGPAAAPVFAQAPPSGATVFVHSALSGELGGGRLTLRGVRRRVTWAHESGRSGALRVERMHRLVFASGKPATGALHVAGHRGGDEVTFTLTAPRYSASRGTVSYQAKQINDGRLPGRAARAAQGAQRFGAASLSIVGATDGGSLTIDNTQIYDCPPPAPSGTACWGIVSGSGLQANSQVGLFGSTDGGMTNYGLDFSANTDGNGTLNPTNLNLQCYQDAPQVQALALSPSRALVYSSWVTQPSSDWSCQQTS